MSLPESSNAPAAQKATSSSTAKPAVSETGDLASAVDFYQDVDNSPAVIDSNDPNDAFEEERETDSGETEEENDEDTESEETGSVGEEEEEGDDSEDEEGGDDDDEGQDVEDDTEGSEEVKKDEKTTVLTIGDKDHDVPLTAIVPTPVNGEIENPTLQDLRNAYSAKASIRKEVEQAKEAKKEISTHRRRVMRDLESKELAVVEKEFSTTKGHKFLEEGNYEAGLNEFFGYDSDKWEKFDELMSNYYSKFAQLSPAERRSIQLDRKNKLFTIKQNLATEAAAMQKEIDAFNTFKRQRMEAAGLEEEEVEDAWDSIVERANKKQLSHSEIQWLQNATPQQKWDTAVGEAVAYKTRAKIGDVIKTQFPKLVNKAKDIITSMEEKLAGKFLIKASKEDIAGIITKDYNGGQVSKTTKKIAPTNSLRDKAQPRHKLREAAIQEDDEGDIYDQSGRDESSNQVWGSQFFK